jgi:multiple sugar transport system permease protein
MKTIIGYKASYVLMAPFLILFFIFTVWPVFISILYSLTSYNGFQAFKFVGFSNYVHLLFKDDLFSTALKNTLFFGFITGPLSFFLCLFFAWLVNELSPKLRAFMTLILYAPSISSNLFVIWLLIFSGDMYGYLNSFLMRLGFIHEPVQWLFNPKYMMAVVIIVQLWISFGTSFLTLRAGFTTIDRQYYEAASLDGMKNRWQELWHITLPMMSPHLLLSAVLSIAAAFSSINVAVALTGFPSTNYATYMIMHFVQDVGMIRLERGYASAAAVVLFLLSLLTNLTAQSIIRKVGK